MGRKKELKALLKEAHEINAHLVKRCRDLEDQLSKERSVRIGSITQSRIDEAREPPPGWYPHQRGAPGMCTQYEKNVPQPRAWEIARENAEPFVIEIRERAEKAEAKLALLGAGGPQFQELVEFTNRWRRKCEVQTRLRVQAEQRAGKRNVAALEARIRKLEDDRDAAWCGGYAAGREQAQLEQRALPDDTTE